MRRSLLLYLGIVGFFAAVIWGIISLGNQIHPNGVAAATSGLTASVSWLDQVGAHFREHLSQPFSVLLIQIVIILTVARVFGVLATKLGQQSE